MFDVRIGVDSQRTRFVIELSGSTKPRIFGLPDPYRVVIDLPEAIFALPADKTGTGGGVIDRMRYGQFQPGTSRLVLDLAGPAKVSRNFLIPPEGNGPWRLVLDLVTTDRDDFIVAMRPKVAAPRAPGVPLRTGPEAGVDNEDVIVLDPGHGGIDPGASGRSGVQEKDLALDYAKEIKRQLEKAGKYTVILTRDRDVFLPLRERVRIARAASADLFLSLHFNANDSRKVRGFSAYTLSERASDKEAGDLAEAENKSDIIGGVDLDRYSSDVASILIDFAQSKTNEQSVTFARDSLVKEVGKSTKLSPRPWRAAGFAVLKAPDVPSVLIEMGYVTNRNEEKLLLDSAYRKQLSSTIVQAIERYFEVAREARRT
ncbi:MAG: N-acetylmuramoyl-L-alanine amidase [Alphaproteobacteria bacterium]